MKDLEEKKTEAENEARISSEKVRSNTVVCPRLLFLYWNHLVCPSLSRSIILSFYLSQLCWLLLWYFIMLHLLPVQYGCQYKLLLYAYKAQHGKAPTFLKEL